MFGPEDTTERVYSGVGKHIVDSFMQGINGDCLFNPIMPIGTIFAYGQTSSGKTYTMHGDESSPGLLYLASKDIFDYVNRTSSREFILRASYVEIYKEEVKDLLDPSTPTLRIRESYERGVYVESKEEVIHNYQEILNVSFATPINLLAAQRRREESPRGRDQHESAIVSLSHHLQDRLREPSPRRGALRRDGPWRRARRAAVVGGLGGLRVGSLHGRHGRDAGRGAEDQPVAVGGVARDRLSGQQVGEQPRVLPRLEADAHSAVLAGRQRPHRDHRVRHAVVVLLRESRAGA